MSADGGATQRQHDAPRRQAFIFTDTGTGRDPGRPEFKNFTVGVTRTPPGPEEDPPVIVVSELSRLFRSRADRAVIDDLIATRRADVATRREDIDTATPEGRERYRLAADLLLLAYEGEPLAAPTRAELIDRYVDEVLDRWLDITRVPVDERAEPLADVRARLRALARRWDGPERDMLLAAYGEVAENHEPAELDSALRALALVGVRNSDLETLHIAVAEPIDQYDWQVLTRAAAYALQTLPDLPDGDLDGEDPFAGVIEDHPTAAAALAALSRLEPGEQVASTPPKRLAAAPRRA